MLLKLKKSRIVPLVLIAVAAVMIYAGYKSDEHLIVFNKAIRICLECIGIG